MFFFFSNVWNSELLLAPGSPPHPSLVLPLLSETQLFTLSKLPLKSCLVSEETLSAPVCLFLFSLSWFGNRTHTFISPGLQHEWFRRFSVSVSGLLELWKWIVSRVVKWWWSPGWRPSLCFPTKQWVLSWLQPQKALHSLKSCGLSTPASIAMSVFRLFNLWVWVLVSCTPHLWSSVFKNPDIHNRVSIFVALHAIWCKHYHPAHFFAVNFP